VVVNVTSHTGGTLPVAYAGPDMAAASGTKVTLNAASSSAPDAMPGLTVFGNDFTVNDTTGMANAVAVTRKANANAVFTATGNNFRKTAGNYLVYLHDFDNAAGTVAMTGNYWGVGTAAELAAVIYDGIDSALLPLVVYDPFLTSAATDAGSNLSYPPMAKVGDDQTVDPDKTVTLSGTGTYDPDKKLTYHWEQTSGKTVTLRNADTATASFDAPSVTDSDGTDANVLLFKLTVTDASGFYDSKTAKVTVNKPTSSDTKDTFKS
jgi:hypothetical protein